MNWVVAIPEIILSVCGMLILVYGVLRRPDQTQVCTMLTLGAFLVTGFLMVTRVGGIGYHGQFTVDPFAVFCKGLILAGAALSLMLALDYNHAQRIERFEFPVLMIFAVVGMMGMVSATNLMTLYLSLELQSLALYVMAAFARDDVRSSEAGLKYFVLGALASGLLLYGISLVYGFSGTMDFRALEQALTSPGSASAGMVVGVVFVIAGLAFKTSAAPFHMWTPDVYEGAPSSVTAFLATAPKVAAIGLFLRVMVQPFGHLLPSWQLILEIISICSMILGAFAAIGQFNIKRLMAYSSIGHMGYALIGLAVGTEAGIRGLLVYLLVYVVHERGHLGLHHRHATPWPGAGEDRGSQRPRSDRSCTGAGLCRVHVQHGGHPAALRLLRQAVRVPRGGPGGDVGARHHRRAQQRGCILLLYADREGDVFRRSGAAV